MCVCVGLKKNIKMKKEANVKKIPQCSLPPFQWQYLSLCPVPTWKPKRQNPDKVAKKEKDR